jgi:hypothetical protein
MSQRRYGCVAATGAGGFVSEAIAATPLGSVGFEAKVDAKGDALWIQAAVIDWLNSPRRPDESSSMSFCGPAEGTELPSRSRFCAEHERDAYLAVARLAFDPSPVSGARNTAQSP